MLNIVRGDTKYYKFKRINKFDGNVITTKPDKMYFTVKFDYNVEDVLIQKTLDNEIKFDEETSYYYFTIKPEDTNKLPYGKYVYDIETTEGDKVTTISIGEIMLTEEVTFYSNKENDGTNGEDVFIEDSEIEEIITIGEYSPIFSGSGTKDYNDLENKPSINDIELINNKSLDDLGIQPKGNYATKEELPDTSSFITKNVDNLINYYEKNRTYTRDEVNELINNAQKLTIELVDILPEQPDTNVIYLVKINSEIDTNLRDEYVYINGHWEKFGDTRIDLTGYAREKYVDDKIQNLIDNDIQTLDDLVDENKNDIKTLTGKIQSIEENIDDIVEDTANDIVSNSIKELVDGDIANLAELIKENQDNIKTNRTNINNLQKNDIKEFNVAPPFRDGLMVVSAVTNNNSNIEAFNIYNGIDGKYSNAAFGTQSAKELADRIKTLEEKVQQLEARL